MFETILEKKLSFNYEKIDYEITLKTNEIKLSSLILIKSKKQYIIKRYLNEIIRKN